MPLTEPDVKFSLIRLFGRTYRTGERVNML